MNFIANTAKYGRLTSKPVAITPPKGSNPRGNFLAKVAEQIALIEDGAAFSKKCWFKEQSDGSYLVWLKNGIRLLPLIDGSNEMLCQNVDAARNYLLAAAEAADAGEFDAMFEQTKPPARKKKEASATTATPSEAAVASAPVPAIPVSKLDAIRQRVAGVSAA